jgi:cell division control protein 24
MKKWSSAVDTQRKVHSQPSHSASSSRDEGPTDFAWMRDQAGTIANPYAEQEEDDDPDYGGPTTLYNTPSNQSYNAPSLPRNASSNSLRSRSATGESTQSLAGMVRAAPPRFPVGFQNPPLSVQTTMHSQQLPSPGQRLGGGDSYFSPIGESPASSRTSGTPSNYPFPRQTTPLGSWDDNNRYDPNRNTAPAMVRVPSRDSQNPPPNGFARQQRPSIPGGTPSPAQAAAAQRSRSYSTPDINGINGSRRMPSISSSAVPAVPGIPAHLHPAYDGNIPRSQNNSPSNALPIRANTQSPGVQRERMDSSASRQFVNGPGGSGPGYMRPVQPPAPIQVVDTSIMSPPLPSALLSGGSDMDLPTQLKVKVNCDGNYVTLVVAFNITYQSLIDRIDAKVGRFSNNAIAQGTMRLRYQDDEGDFVTIASDDDIQIAFQDWREAQGDQFYTGKMGEIELFCLSVD